MREKLTAVLDCGEAAVAWSLFRRSGETLWLVDRQVESLDGLSATMAEWGELTGSALRRLRPRCPGRRAVVATVPAPQLLVRMVRVEAPGRRPGAALSAAVAEALPCPLDEVEWGAIPAGPAGSGDHFLMAARTAAMAELCRAITTAGFALADLVPAPLGLVRLARGRAPAAAERLVLSLGARSGTLVGVDATGCVVRSFQLESGAEGQGRAEAVVREVNRSLAFLAAQGRVTAAEVIELADDHGEIGAELARRAGRPVSPLAAPVRRDDAAITGGIVLAAGTAWLAREAPARRISLLPARERMAPDPRRRPVLAFAVMLLLAWIAAANLCSQRLREVVREESAALASRLAAAAGREAAMKADRRRLDYLRGLSDELDRLQQRRDGWVRLLEDLGEALAVLDRTHLERIEVLPRNAIGHPKSAPPPRLRLAGSLEGGGAEAGPRALALLGAVGALPAVQRVERQRFEAGADRTRFELVVSLGRNAGL